MDLLESLCPSVRLTGKNKKNKILFLTILCVKDKAMMIVMEYAAGGTLCEFIQDPLLASIVYLYRVFQKYLCLNIHKFNLQLRQLRPRKNILQGLFSC